MKTMFFYLVGFMLFGCATSNYNASAGACVDDGINAVMTSMGFSGPSGALIYCREQEHKNQLAKDYEHRLANNPAFAASEAEKKKQDIARAEEEAREAAKQKKIAAALDLRRKKAVLPGAPIAEFIYCFGTPDTQEMVNGNKVLWYDSSTPMFVHFTNGKLTSMIIDRQTIRDRNESQNNAAAAIMAERRHRDMIAESRAARNEAAWQNYFNNQQANDRMQKQINSQPTTTNCRKDFQGNLTCNSW